MPIYLSMQRVRFSSPDAYEKFKATNGAIMEDIIINFELIGTRLIRVCPVCNKAEDKKYDLAQEQAVLHEVCPQCGFHFPVLEETPSSFAVFKDVPGLATNGKEEKEKEEEAETCPVAHQ
ncbi:hypothetical protein ACHAPQ_011999 [Fusarium lateritium]